MKIGMIAALAGLAVSGAASAAFTGYQTVRTVDGTFVKYEVFAQFNNPADYLLSVINIQLVSGTANFFHRDALNGGMSSNVAGSWSAGLMLAPGALDSYLTVGVNGLPNGGESFAGNNLTGFDPNWGGAGANQAQIPFATNPGIFTQNPTNGQGGQGGTGRVKIGQFVIAAADEATGPTIRATVGFNQGLGTPATETTSTFSLPAPGAVALLGLAGLAGRRRR